MKNLKWISVGTFLSYCLLGVLLIQTSSCTKDKDPFIAEADYLEWFHRDSLGFWFFETTSGFETPAYLDGGFNNFKIRLFEEMVYPAQARENGTEGTVEVQFEVKVDGTMGELEIITNIPDGCGEEVLRALSTLCSGICFEPGTINGETLWMKANLEVTFRLEQ